MGKPDQESAAAEEARRATGDAAGRGRGGRLRSRKSAATVNTSYPTFCISAMLSVAIGVPSASRDARNL